MALVLKSTQKAALSIAVVDAKGNPAQVEGAPVWSSSDPTVTVTASEDGLSADVVAAGNLGTAQVRVTADADLGEGVRHIEGLLDVDVIAGDAVAVTIAAGAPTEQ